MTDEEEIARIEHDSLTEGYIPSADAGWLIDKLRSAREDGARMPAIREAAVATDALLCRIAKSFDEIGERETAQSLRQAGLAMTVATAEMPATPTGREMGNGTEGAK